MSESRTTDAIRRPVNHNNDRNKMDAGYYHCDDTQSDLESFIVGVGAESGNEDLTVYKMCFTTFQLVGGAALH